MTRHCGYPGGPPPMLSPTAEEVAKRAAEVAAQHTAEMAARRKGLASERFLRARDALYAGIEAGAFPHTIEPAQFAELVVRIYAADLVASSIDSK